MCRCFILSFFRVHEITEAEHEVDPYACIVNASEKDKFLFLVNYRGKESEHFSYSLKKLNVHCKVIMTMVKTKSVVSTLKASVPRMLQSNVVYQ